MNKRISFLKLTDDKKNTVPWRLVLLFILFTAGILITGIFYYLTQRNRLIEEQQNDLTAISQLKINQIISWHKERLGDAEVIRDNSLIFNPIAAFVRDNSNDNLKTEILNWMNSLGHFYDYKGVVLADTTFRVLLSVMPEDTVAGDAITRDLKEVMVTGKPIITDLHNSKCVSYVHMDLIIPIAASVINESKAVAVLILRIDPSKVLFPLIQSWPTPSKSSETLLARKEGDSILFLNELRHVSNSEMKLKAALSNEDLLAVKAIKGSTGLAEGIDYRNIKVIGSLNKIPDFPWYMVAKVDREEIIAPTRRYLIITIFVALLLILINASALWFFSWEQRVRSYRDQLKDQLAIRESEEKFATAFNMSPVSITLSRVIDNILIDVNDTFLVKSEYVYDEVIGKTPYELGLWADDVEREIITREIANTGRVLTKLCSYRSKSGKTIFGLTSMSTIKVKSEPCILSTVVDMTENINAQEELRSSEERYKKTLDSMMEGCQILDFNWKYLYLNDTADVHNRRSKDELLGHIYMDMWPGIEKTEVFKNIERCMIDRVNVHMENDFVYPDGVIRSFDLRINTVPEGVFILSIDITEIKKASEAVRNSEARFRQTFDLSPVGIVMVGFDKCFIRCNNAFAQSLGYLT